MSDLDDDLGVPHLESGTDSDDEKSPATGREQKVDLDHELSKENRILLFCKKTETYDFNVDDPIADMVEHELFRRAVIPQDEIRSFETLATVKSEKTLDTLITILTDVNNLNIKIDDKESFKKTFPVLEDDRNGIIQQFYTSLTMLSSSPFIAFAAQCKIKKLWTIGVNTFDNNIETDIFGSLCLYLIGALVSTEYLKSEKTFTDEHAKFKNSNREKAKESIQNIVALRNASIACDFLGFSEFREYAVVNFILIPAAIRYLKKSNQKSVSDLIPWIVKSLENDDELKWMVTGYGSVYLPENSALARSFCTDCFIEVQTPRGLIIDQRAWKTCPTEIVNKYVCDTVVKWSSTAKITCKNKHTNNNFYRSAFSMYPPRFIAATFNESKTFDDWHPIKTTDIPAGPTAIGSFGKYRVVAYELKNSIEYGGHVVQEKYCSANKIQITEFNPEVSDESGLSPQEKKNYKILLNLFMKSMEIRFEDGGSSELKFKQYESIQEKKKQSQENAKFHQILFERTE